MRRLFLVASVTTIAAAVVHCSHPTELVVAVDTDLVAGVDIDKIEVAVDGPSGNVFDKKADVLSPSALPLTLGVAAGSTDDAEVHVIATALKNGAPVARTEVVARFSPGESRFVQVSICKSCGLTCGRNLGSSLPEWNDSLPPKNACDTTFADAGNFDSGRDSGPIAPGDGGGTTDAPADAPEDSSVADAPFDAAICGDGCPSGTTCKGLGCSVQGEPSCASNPIEITGPRTFVGKVCAATSSSANMCTDTGGAEKLHAFVNASATSFSVKITALSQTMRTNRVDSSCVQTAAMSCATVNPPGGTAGFALGSGQYVAVGAELASGCVDYRVEVK